ncbi:hypothetical protein HYPDE_22608 [Hyphomicrobium denitrificans 1NES1]|uniref:UspA domain-containing protein n=1 Tax=Hyphomicrobium denitrificans 1NES1 TaxID=670307 RepID=N0AZW7_9HYPH|nr:hypothetical protein [Hyphomicrobium denitrificans]AGK56208.1 hypothetical protein HYPDE_22608 [Hyphomicrobium denitrificans 1NES1]
MIAHVAEASELSGRVVLWLDPEARCTPAVLDAPMRLAAAYDAEIETIVVDQCADESGDVPFRRIGQVGLPDIPPIAHRFQLLAQRCRRTVEDASRVHKVKVRHALAQGDAVDRISEMCLMRGPWNIVALTGIQAVGSQSVINSLLANVSGATGFLLCGERPEKKKAGVGVIVEDGERLPSMLRAAERLSQPDVAIHLVIGAETSAEYAELEHQARLLTAEASIVTFAPAGPTFGVPGALTEIVARMKPAFVVARFGGAAFSDGRELSRASAAIQAPILLVR